MQDDLWEALMTHTNGVSDLKCPHCSSPMVLRTGTLSNKFFSCTRWPDCRGSHAAHPDGKPTGVPANEKTKAARRKGHEVFEQHRMRHNLTKNACYRKLARAMRISRKECHFGLFDLEQCERAIAILAK